LNGQIIMNNSNHRGKNNLWKKHGKKGKNPLVKNRKHDPSTPDIDVNLKKNKTKDRKMNSTTNSILSSMDTPYNENHTMTAWNEEKQLVNQLQIRIFKIAFQLTIHD